MENAGGTLSLTLAPALSVTLTLTLALTLALTLLVLTRLQHANNKRHVWGKMQVEP